MGGGSSVNCMKSIFVIDALESGDDMWTPVMMYTRAAASDYDDWENVHGNKGWGSKYLIPLLKKVTSFTFHLHAN